MVLPIRVAQYARFMTKDGTLIPDFAFQNFFVDEERNWEGTNYAFGAFLFNGSLGGGAGESKDAGILGTPNSLTVPVFSEAVEKFWLVEIKRVGIGYDEDLQQFAEDSTLTTEIWDCSAMPRDNDKIVIRLGDPFDAVKAQIPRRRLTASLVGSLPSTGNISLQ